MFAELSCFVVYVEGLWSYIVNMKNLLMFVSNLVLILLTLCRSAV